MYIPKISIIKFSVSVEVLPEISAMESNYKTHHRNAVFGIFLIELMERAFKLQRKDNKIYYKL